MLIVKKNKFIIASIIILLIIGISILFFIHEKRFARRITCLSKLRSIGSVLALYYEDYAGHLPENIYLLKKKLGISKQKRILEADAIRLEFTYDYTRARVTKKVWTMVNGTLTLTGDFSFIYHGTRPVLCVNTLTILMMSLYS